VVVRANRNVDGLVFVTVVVTDEDVVLPVLDWSPTFKRGVDGLADITQRKGRSDLRLRALRGIRARRLLTNSDLATEYEGRHSRHRCDGDSICSHLNGFSR